MLEARGNLWDLARGHLLCITTNGFIKSNGECVMGRGIAQEAKNRFPEIPKLLGNVLKEKGNRVHILGLFDNYILASFPVKPAFCTDQEQLVSHMRLKVTPGKSFPGWAARADLSIIKQSCKELRTYASYIPKEIRIYLPRPGCGAGELSWEVVRKILQENLPESRYVVCTF